MEAQDKILNCSGNDLYLFMYRPPINLDLQTGYPQPKFLIDVIDRQISLDKK